jgi:hypothetical protein
MKHYGLRKKEEPAMFGFLKKKMRAAQLQRLNESKHSRAALLTFFLDLKEVYHKRRVNLA